VSHHPPPSTSHVALGCYLGISNAIVVATLFALSVASGAQTLPVNRPVFSGSTPDPASILVTIVCLAFPVGLGCGAMFGSMTRSVAGYSKYTRIGCYVMVADFAMLFAAWPCWDLLPGAFIPTTIHAILLARWTTPPDRIPPMRVVDERLALPAGGEVLRVGVREVEPRYGGRRVHRERLGEGHAVVCRVVE